jgi:bacillithiol biosynthesis deacetylase BshB1
MPRSATSSQCDLLFISAHADDTELSCGGTIAKAVKDGLRVGMIDLTQGEMGTRGTPRERAREAARSARILGAVFREHLDFGDGGLRGTRDEELQLIDIVRRCRPKVVFSPYPDERHPDHARAGRLITDSSFYAGLRQLKTSLDAHRPQAVVYYLQNYMFTPSFIVDVSAAWKTKMRAVASFKSQFYDPKSKQPATFISSQKFIDMIEARGKHFGALIGMEYGEAYVTKQPPKIENVIEAYEGREP